MTDQEKIEWFDKNVAWLKTFGDTTEEIIEYSEGCCDLAYDLLFDFINQMKKV